MRVNVRLPLEDRVALDEEAKRLGVSVSDLVRMVIKTYLPEFTTHGLHINRANPKPDA